MATGAHLLEFEPATPQCTRANGSYPLIKVLVPEVPRVNDLLVYLHSIDQNRWYSNFGPLNSELQSRLSSRMFSGVQCVTLSSATDALELTLGALNLKPGSRVLIPDFTFIGTATAVLRAGCVPVTADVARHSWLLSTETARAAMERADIKAVVPVAALGCPQEPEAWDDFARLSGVPVVIDAAGAMGNQRVGTLAHVVFSLHATKALPAGEGGVVVSTDVNLLEKIRRQSNFGIESTSGLVQTPGTNAKMSEYHAAVALASLDRWEETSQRRQSMWLEYKQMLVDACPELEFQDRPDLGIYTLAPCLLPVDASVVNTGELLRQCGIETRRWYCPQISKQPFFRGDALGGEFPVASDVCARLLGMPFHLGMHASDRSFVAHSLAAALQSGSR